MIQFLWAFDFIGIFLSRLIVAYLYFNYALENFKNDKIKSAIYFISSLMIGLGFLTSIISIFWIIAFIALMIKERKLDNLKLLFVAYFIILLTVGPSLLSIDRIFDIRLTK